MVLDNASFWPPFQRPRARSFHEATGVGGEGRTQPGAISERRFDALDLDLRELSRSPRGNKSRQKQRVLIWRPLPRPAHRRGTFFDLEADYNVVQEGYGNVGGVRAEDLPHLAAAKTLLRQLAAAPQNAPQAPSQGGWPKQDVTLFRGAQERFVLHKQGRRFGLYWGFSVVSVHHDAQRAADKAQGRPQLLVIAKTFALHDVTVSPPQPGAEQPGFVMQANPPYTVANEITSSLIPGRILTQQQPRLHKGYQFAPPRPHPGTSGGQRGGSEATAGSFRREPKHTAATSIQPLAVLRQIEGLREFWHVLYPVSTTDGQGVIDALRQAKLAAGPLRASCEVLGLPLISAMTDAMALHDGNYFHQDIKASNLFFDRVVDVARPRPHEGPSGTAFVRRLQARLADYAYTTPNNNAAEPIVSLHIRAPEAFLSADAVEAGMVASQREECYERGYDDIWSFGILLFRLLAPHFDLPAGYDARQQELCCPLVADYRPQIRNEANKSGKVRDENRRIWAENHQKAQKLRQAWQEVHRQWTRYMLQRRALQPGEVLGPRPQGNCLPTPNGARIDEALGHIADLRVDFLQLLLLALSPAPKDRPAFERLQKKAMDMWNKFPTDDPVRAQGNATLLQLVQPTQFSAECERHKEQADACP